MSGDLPQRRSPRLVGYDYAQDGAYFVTICTQGRTLLFADAAVRAIAERCWLAIPEPSPGVLLDEWVVMPNHVHGLIVIGGRAGQGEAGVLANAPMSAWVAPGKETGTQVPDRPAFPHVAPRAGALGAIIRAYKAAVTASCRREGFSNFGWQRGYHDRIVRNERELAAIRRYIIDNPQRWAQDEHHPSRKPGGKPPTST